MLIEVKGVDSYVVINTDHITTIQKYNENQTSVFMIGGGEEDFVLVDKHYDDFISLLQNYGVIFFRS